MDPSINQHPSDPLEEGTNLVKTIITIALVASNCSNIPSGKVEIARSYLERLHAAAINKGETVPNVERMLLYLNSHMEQLPAVRAHGQTTNNTENTQNLHQS